MTQDSLFSKVPAPANALEPVQGVSRVVDYIRRLLEQNRTLGGLRVRGEVSDLRERSGRLYFDLKENNDVLKCVVWANNAAKLPPLKDGTEVICDGDFTIYAPYGQYQLIVRNVELSGIGALYAQFEALKEKFRKEGLFEKARKRPMPQFPTRVAVISTPDGRGVEDFFTTLAREAPFVQPFRVPTRVEGEGAEIDVAEAIDKASKMNVDVIVVTRGGGSYESLFTFNREPVLRAIVRSKHPVISAIGHTQDVQLSDFVADESCETPSNAAHWFGQIGKRFLTQVQRSDAEIEHAIRRIFTARAQRYDDASARLVRSIRDCWRESERRVQQLERSLNAQTPQRRLAKRGERLASLRSTLHVLSARPLLAQRERLTVLGGQLDRLQTSMLAPSKRRFELLDARLTGANPQSPLERGYAIVTLDGHTVRDAAAVPEGATIEAQVQHGKLWARVERKNLDG